MHVCYPVYKQHEYTQYSEMYVFCKHSSLDGYMYICDIDNTQYNGI